MTAKHILIQTCQIIVMFHYTNTYVLLTANLDDFRSIAKKFMPDKLADQLSGMASPNRQKASESDLKEYEDDDINYNVQVRSSEVRATKTRDTQKKKRFSIQGQPHNINFDELVQKVREQIENDNKNKLREQENNDNSNNKEYIKDDPNNYNEDEGYSETTYKDENLPKRLKNNPQRQQNDNKYIKDDSKNYNENQGNREPTYKDENLPKRFKNNPQRQQKDNKYVKDDSKNYNQDQGNREPTYNDENLPKRFKNNPQRQQKDNKYIKDDSKNYNEDQENREPTYNDENLPKQLKNNVKKILQEQPTADYDDENNAKDPNKDVYYNENDENPNTKYQNQEDKPYEHDEVTESSQKNYYDNVKETDVVENDDIFKTADLTKVHDSYEDYITPKRENVFESDSETTTTLNEHAGNMHSEKSRYRGDKIKAVAFAENERDLEYDENENGRISEEVKAKTESLNYQKGDNQKKLKGTVIPTREYFKLSSPNYYGKLPIVAEKYDFNEPLPEADRVPESLTYVKNAPVLVNKKVRLSSA